MENKQIPDNYLLVPKPGKTVEFTRAFENMATIANGTLGWKGQAEVMVKAGIHDALGIKFDPGLTEAQLIEAVQSELKQSFLHELYQYGEWLPPEQAEKRMLAEKALYGESK